MLLCRIVLFLGGEKRKKHSCAKECGGKYQVVDAETRKIVDTRDRENTPPDRNNPITRRKNLRLCITLTLYVLSGLSAIACIAVPNEWKGVAALLFLIFFAALCVDLRINR